MCNYDISYYVLFLCHIPFTFFLELFVFIFFLLFNHCIFIAIFLSFAHFFPFLLINYKAIKYKEKRVNTDNSTLADNRSMNV